jgi:DNA-binding MarR family transcriptional regulator
MDALDLIVLGRQLTRIGEEALRASRSSPTPTGSSLVLRDVFMNPDSSINDIAERTVLPQSYVSESVAKLVVQGLVHTKVDSNDKRRTLVRVNKVHLRNVARAGSIPVEAALIKALGSTNTETETLAALTMLSDRFKPKVLGPALRQVRSAQEPRR